MGTLSILCGLAAMPALAANTVTLPGGATASNPGAAQTVLASDVATAQGSGALKSGTFAGLAFQANWFVTPTELSFQNGNQLDQWTLFSSNNGNLFNLTSVDFTWLGGQADTVQGWVNYYLNGVLVDTGSNKLADNANPSLAFVGGKFGETTHVNLSTTTFYDRIDIAWQHSITPNSVGMSSFAIRSSSSTVPFGLAAPSNGGAALDLPTTTVPEPETNALLLAGLAAIGLMTRRRQTGKGSIVG